MTDIVERLRARNMPLADKAADEIERLRAELLRVEKELHFLETLSKDQK